MMELPEILKNANACGIAHNHGAGGEWLLCAKKEQLLAFVERIQATAFDKVIIAKEHVITGADVGRPNQRPTLGYVVPMDTVLHPTHDEASVAINAAALPIGWVRMHVRQLFNMARPAAPKVEAGPRAWLAGEREG